MFQGKASRTQSTVDSRCCGQPRGKDLEPVIARVHNSGVLEKKLFALKVARLDFLGLIPPNFEH